MGRAMLIILSGVIIALGIIGMSTSEQGKTIINRNADYAEFVKAKNAAHTAIQMAMQEMNEDSTWGKSHDKSNVWADSIEGTPTELYVNYIYESPDFWNPDTIRIVSTAFYETTEEVTVAQVYLKNAFDFVPGFKSPLTIATNNFTLNTGGSASINGNDPTGGQCQDMPGLTVMSDSDSTYAADQTSGIDVQGDPAIDTDTTTSYQPTDRLVARLENMDGVQHISGNYKGDMGTQDNPGVFFVEDNAKLTGGISEGYGILVVRSGGELAYEDSTGTALDIAGNFKFNGLVIFENAFNLDGSGTPTINGSVLVGNTPDSNQQIDIDINGNLSLQYDCTAEEYAKKAAALTVTQNQYRRISTFE